MVIEQEFHNDLHVDKSICLVLKQIESCITLDTQGAKQLIKVLQEFVNENN